MAKKKKARTPKKKKSVNKTQAIKDALAASPDASPKDVAQTLSKGGVSVTPGTVSTVKWSLKKAQRKRKRGRPRKTGDKKRRVAKDGPVSVDSLVLAKELTEKAGGIAEARKLLDVLAKLQ